MGIQELLVKVCPETRPLQCVECGSTDEKDLLLCEDELHRCSKCRGSIKALKITAAGALSEVVLEQPLYQTIKPVVKAETPSQLSQKEDANASEWIEPTADMKGFKAKVAHSSILPQCIRAYKNNIAGFGIGIRYKDDVEETKEMGAEFEKATDIIELLNMDMDTKELFEDVIESRETYGIAYTEVLRNVASGEITGLDFIKDTPSVRKTIALDPYIDVAYNFKGRIETRPKRFCKYKQTIGSKTVYFKEVGDPRARINVTANT